MTTHSSILAWRIPTDRGAWPATVRRVTQSRTRLKRLSMHLVRRGRIRVRDREAEEGVEHGDYWTGPMDAKA